MSMSNVSLYIAMLHSVSNALKTNPTVALINDNRRIKINDYSLSFVPL